MDSESLMDISKAKETLEPTSTREATNCVVKILSATYKKTNLAQVTHDHCHHLSSQQQNKLLRLLVEYEDLFDGTLGDFKMDPVSFKLKEGITPYHGRVLPVLHSQLAMIRKEVDRLEKTGVLKRQPGSEWASPSFPIAKKTKLFNF